MSTFAVISIVILALFLGTLMVLGFMYEEKVVAFEERLSKKIRFALYKKFFLKQKEDKAKKPALKLYAKAVQEEKAYASHENVA